jgi:hypothetical protein
MPEMPVSFFQSTPHSDSLYIMKYSPLGKMGRQKRKLFQKGNPYGGVLFFASPSSPFSFIHARESSSESFFHIYSDSLYRVSWKKLTGKTDDRSVITKPRYILSSIYPFLSKMSDIENTLPTASAVVNDAPVPRARKIRVKKPVVAEPIIEAIPPVVEVVPAPVEELMEEAPVENTPAENPDSDDTTITIKKSEWEALLSRIAVLENKPVPTKAEKEKKAPATRVPTKDAVLKNILRDGEVVYSKELINDGEKKGQYRTFSATFNYKHNGFYINSIEEYDYDADSNEFKTPYAQSPTTLCSRFRHLMKQHSECKKGSSTTCGFAKCYVIRDEKEVKLSKLLSK